MAAPIMSRDKIAQLAENAAADWVAQPQRPRPVNPFDALEQPDHHEAWRAAFDVALLQHSSGVTA